MVESPVVIENTKICRACKRVLGRHWFRTVMNKASVKLYERPDCIECDNAKSRKNDASKLANGLTVSRDRRLRYCYGVSSTKYLEMYKAQNGKCAVCTESLGDSGHVDHNHKDGTVRGLLCGHCNRGMGLFKDNSEFLRRAAEYLDDHEWLQLLKSEGG